MMGEKVLDSVYFSRLAKPSFPGDPIEMAAKTQTFPVRRPPGVSKVSTRSFH